MYIYVYIINILLKLCMRKHDSDFEGIFRQ